MNILVKAYQDVYVKLNGWHQFCHCSYYYPFLFMEIFRREGSSGQFVGQVASKQEVITNPHPTDVLFFWGLESFIFDKEYSETLLKNHTGKKVLYITCQTNEDMVQYFDIIFATEWEGYADYYKKKYPDKLVYIVPFASPLFSFVDEIDKNPYADQDYKLIYTGIITSRYLEILNKLGDLYTVYVGGIYSPPKGGGCRHFTINEIKTIINPKLKLITPEVNFQYGYHFHYLKYADLGLNFFPSPHTLSKPVNSKLIDYLVCGLPMVSENANVGNFRLNQFQAGFQCKWNNFDDLVNTIEIAKKEKFDKLEIQKKAREVFNPITVGKQIIKEIS